jgi:hypothetical protein
MAEIKEETAREHCERVYPEMMAEFAKIQNEMYETFCKKQRNYGPGNISVGTSLQSKEDIKLSLTAIWIRMNDKMNRLKNLDLKNTPNPLDNEPILDAWIDLVNYSIIAQLVSTNKWKK